MDDVTPPRIVVVSMNPRSGAVDSNALVERLSHELQQRGLQVVVSTNLSEVKSESQRYSESGRLSAVVSAGGDGTITLLANELPAETPFAILPLGTENLLAKYLGLTADPVRLARLIDKGHSICLDAGRANGKLFLVMASCGFDADVVKRMHAIRKGHIRHWSYAWPIMGAIGKYRYPELRLTVDGDKSNLNVRWAFVFNVPRYAMNLPIVHDADSADGMLDLCTFRQGSLASGLVYLMAVITGQHRRWRKERVQRFRRLRIDSDGSVPFQLDGDPGGELPLEIEVQPKFLRVIVDSEGRG